MSESIPKSELTHRIHRFQQKLASADIDGAMILQKPDLYYFSGTIQQAHLYVPAAGLPLLMVRKSLDRAIRESSLEQIVPLTSTRTIPDLLTAHGLSRPSRIGLECDVLPVNLFNGFQKIFPNAELVDISTPVRMIRSVKSEFELALVREASRLADEVSAGVPDVLREGMTELELAGLVEASARARGHQGILRMRLWGNELFYGHLMAGPSAAEPSYLASPTGGTGAGPAVAQGAGFRRIQRNEPVLVDYVFAHNGYLTDHTRIFSIGELPEDMMAGHEAMCRIQEDLMTRAIPGVHAGSLYEQAVSLAAEMGYAAHFMGAGEDRVRFVGHGIGLELDEFPFLADRQTTAIEEGMVIALEPKLVFPGRGVVGIENTHVATATGLARLTRHSDAVQVIP